MASNCICVQQGSGDKCWRGKYSHIGAVAPASSVPLRLAGLAHILQFVRLRVVPVVLLPQLHIAAISTRHAWHIICLPMPGLSDVPLMPMLVLHFQSILSHTIKSFLYQSSSCAHLHACYACVLVQSSQSIYRLVCLRIGRLSPAVLQACRVGPWLYLRVALAQVLHDALHRRVQRPLQKRIQISKAYHESPAAPD